MAETPAPPLAAEDHLDGDGIDVEIVDAKIDSQLRREEEVKRKVDIARQRLRPVGWLMVATGVFVAANIAVNGTTFFLAQAEVRAAANFANNDAAFRISQLRELFCILVLFIPPVILLFVGAHSLLKFGAHGLIVTSTVMCFLMIVLLGGGLVINIAVLLQPNNPVRLMYMAPTMVMNGVSCLLLLVTAILSVMMLSNREVNDAYDASSRLARVRRSGFLA